VRVEMKRFSKDELKELERIEQDKVVVYDFFRV